MKRIGLALLFCLIATASFAACPGGSTCESFSVMTSPVTGGTTNRTEPDRWKNAYVNILEYGAKCDGSTDDTASIQAAIDYAYAQKIETIYVPPTGSACKFVPPLFVDAPANLRGSAAAWSSGTTYASGNTITYLGKPWASLQNSNLNNTPALGSSFWGPTTATPTIFSFSLCLVGERGQANHEGFGSRLSATSNITTGIWLGTGQQPCIKDIALIGPSGSYRKQQNSAGVGISIAGGSGGASGTRIERTWVENFYTCYQTGSNQDSLAEDNEFDHPRCENGAVGIDFKQTQNDSNQVHNPQLNANIGIQSIRGVNVYGGEWGGFTAKAAKFGISSVSALSQVNCPTTATANGCYQFTATIASPDAYWASGDYNAFTFRTTSFGIVPATMTAYNSGTGVATFVTWDGWSQYYFQAVSYNAASSSDLQTEMQAVTNVYAAERVTFFAGAGFSSYGLWAQQQDACSTVIAQTIQYGNDTVSHIDRAHFDYDPAFTLLGPTHSPSDHNLATYYCQQAFPFIQNAINSKLALTNSTFSAGQSAGYDSVLLEIFGPNTGRIDVQNTGLFNPNIRSVGGYQSGSAPPITGSSKSSYAALGDAVNFDVPPFFASNNTAVQAQNAFVTSSVLSTPYRGFFPAPWTTTRVPSSLLTVWQTVPPGTLGAYPLMNGSTIYSVIDWNSGTLAKLWARSAHKFFSYGANLTTTNVSGLSLSWKGQSFAVTADANTLSWMFPGLGVKLNNGGGDVDYIVTGVYPGMGYFTVLNAAQDGSPYLLAGTKTTTYNATAIGQASYSITQY